MKQSELEKKLSNISEHIKKTCLIENLYSLTIKEGTGFRNEKSFNTVIKYNFENEELKIYLNDGWSEFGGGELKVFYKDKMVLHVDRYALDNKEELIPRTDNWGVLKYIPGEWESQIKEGYNKSLEKKVEVKEEKVLDKEIPESVLKILKENFNLE